jgi:hypothetical protein
MTKYEIREYQSMKDTQHHLDIYENEILKSSFLCLENGYENIETGEIEKGTFNDLMEKEIYGDLDEYEISEQNLYSVKSTFYILYE